MGVNLFQAKTLIVDRWRRNVISQTRKLRHRDHEITARQNRAKAAIKQEQSDARIDSAEREQARRQMPSIDAETCD